MPYNPGCKVMIGNETIIDLTSDTVAAGKMLSGVTAHDNSGAVVTGTMYHVGSLYVTESSTDNPATILGVGTWTLIPAARTVGELKAAFSQGFITTGSIYVWRRTA